MSGKEVRGKALASVSFRTFFFGLLLHLFLCCSWKAGGQIETQEPEKHKVLTNQPSASHSANTTAATLNKSPVYF